MRCGDSSGNSSQLESLQATAAGRAKPAGDSSGKSKVESGARGGSSKQVASTLTRDNAPKRAYDYDEHDPFHLEDAAKKAQWLFLAGAGRNVDGVAVMGAAFGTAYVGDSGELRERAAAEGDPLNLDDDNGRPGQWVRGMLPGDTGTDEIQEETSGTVQVMGTALNTLDNQDAGASGHKESAPRDGRTAAEDVPVEEAKPAEEAQPAEEVTPTEEAAPADEIEPAEEAGPRKSNVFPTRRLSPTPPVSSDDIEKERAMFVRCSGMHTKAVRDIVKSVTEYNCCFVWNPFSCMEYVIPAFTKGVPQQIDALCVMHGEIAVYAALFMTLYVGAYIGGYAPPSSKYDNMRTDSSFGYYIGIGCGIINIITSILYRAASATLARESDMLVFIFRSRKYGALNIVVFCAGAAFGLYYGLGSADASMRRGDHCLDGSMSFVTWWYEWALDDFPLGKGVINPTGQPIENPWAIKAKDLNITRPQTQDMSMDFMSHASFPMFTEFMHDHFELKGKECFDEGKLRNWLGVLSLLVFPLVLFFIRNSNFYWLNHWICCDFFGSNDPFDLSAVAKDFAERAEVSEKLASRDLNRDSFVDSNFEGMDLGQDTTVTTEDSTKRSAQIESYQVECTMNAAPYPVVTDDADTISTMGIGRHFGSPVIGSDGNTIAAPHFAASPSSDKIVLFLNKTVIVHPGDRLATIKELFDNRLIDKAEYHAQRAVIISSI